MSKQPIKCDLLVIGAGVIGLSIGIAFLERFPLKKVVVAEKEDSIGKHASGRNSGVLHAGFYYSPDSLKAKFCRDGNLELRKLAKKHKIRIREVGKVVVSRNSEENLRLDQLNERGIRNGVDLELLDAALLPKFEPLARTTERFLWSPTTAVSSPLEIINALQVEFEKRGGKVLLKSKIELIESNGEIFEKTKHFNFSFVINAAGAHADHISREINVGVEYAMVPFMGVYRATAEKNLMLKRLVYPVPHLINPFLGVHFTLTIDGLVKIGPTAIPIFGREQYSLQEGWSISEFMQTLKGAGALARGESHNFRDILKSEWPKISVNKMVEESSQLVPAARSKIKWHKKPPGIRAQLVHLPTGKLEQDFVAQKYLNSVHILNAVSPGWTSSIPFANWIIDELVKKEF
jgi:(S)-2-hydroxyglutarate dehydrogenase